MNIDVSKILVNPLGEVILSKGDPLTLRTAIALAVDAPPLTIDPKTGLAAPKPVSAADLRKRNELWDKVSDTDNVDLSVQELAYLLDLTAAGLIISVGRAVDAAINEAC